MATRRRSPPKRIVKRTATAPRTSAAAGPQLSTRRLRELIEEATVDSYDEDEARMGFLAMIEDELAVPFDTEVLGVQVEVAGVVENDAGELVAVRKRGGHEQRISLADLPLPSPPPAGAEWIVAWRHRRGAHG